MKDYEITLILSPHLTDEQANDILAELVSFIQDQGALLHDQNILGKKPLLAPIQSQKEGYLAFVGFNATPDKIASLEKKCKETQHILRFMLLVKPSRKAAKPPRILSTPTLNQQDRPREVVGGEKKVEKEKIELKDIDEKLKEIFEEQ